MKRNTVPSVVAMSLLVAGVLSGTGCGTADPGGSDGPAVGTIEQALAAEPGTVVRVRGALVVSGADVVLATALLESYPPQAGGVILEVKGLDLDSLVGLNSTAGQPDLAQVTWSDYQLTLEGVIEDGALEVQKVPRSIESSSQGMRIRFAPVSEPLSAGDALWWALDVKNIDVVPLELVFTSGQRGDVILTQSGVEKYRWSADKFFTEAIETVGLEPGQVVSVVLRDVLMVAPGDYELTARITASVGPAGGGWDAAPGPPLPEVRTTITVR
ncbi:MAG: BsuPI-related putative proteinase inhibitor [bacterium]